MNGHRRWIVAVIVGLLCAITVDARQADVAAIVQFQRDADSYAFKHRQIQRQLGGDPNRSEMAAAIRTWRPGAQDGDLFSPMIASVLRARIAAARRSYECRSALTESPGAVPRTNQDAGASPPLPACIAAVLPRLPEELEYRYAAVAVLLVDTHAHLVVDVLHGAFAEGMDQ